MIRPLAGHTVALAGVTEHNSTRQATVDIVTLDFFETLGVQPVHGRDFTNVLPMTALSND